jgi:hypothetical protein
MVLTVQDQAPTGLTVLSFGIQITNVTLMGSGTQSNVTLVSNPVTLNLANLMAVAALLADKDVPAGTYSSMSITFSTPRLNVLNNSGGNFTDGTNTCPTTTVTTTTCNLSPTLTESTVTISSSPFPLTLTAGSPVHVAIDFNSTSSIADASGTISINPTVTVTSSSTLNASTNDIADFAADTGEVTAVGNNQVVVTDMSTGQTLTLATNSGTTLTGFNTSSTCTTANTLACVAPGQLINFNFGISGTSGAVPTLQRVNLDSGISSGVEGTVTGVNHSTNQFDVLVTGFTPGTQVSGLSVGQTVLVNPSPGAAFSAETNGATLPTGLSFSGVNTVGVGQSVLLNSTGFTAGSGSTPGTLTTNSVLLVPSQFSGTVGTLNAGSESFTLTGLNGLFTLNGVPTVTVDTGTSTDFTGVPGLTGLNPGEVATTGGLVFITPSGTVVTGTQVETVPTT